MHVELRVEYGGPSLGQPERAPSKRGRQFTRTVQPRFVALGRASLLITSSLGAPSNAACRVMLATCGARIRGSRHCPVPEEQGIWHGHIILEVRHLAEAEQQGLHYRKRRLVQHQTWKKVIETSVLVSFAQDSDRLITSYPTKMSRQTC